MTIIYLLIGIAVLLIGFKTFYDYGKHVWWNKYQDLKETSGINNKWFEKYKREMGFHNLLIKKHKDTLDKLVQAEIDAGQLNDYAVAVRYYASRLMMWFQDHPEYESVKFVKELMQYRKMIKAITDVPDCYAAKPDKYPSLAKPAPAERKCEAAEDCGCPVEEEYSLLRPRPDPGTLNVTFNSNDKYKEKLKKIRFMAANASMYHFLQMLERETECVSSLKMQSRKPDEKPTETKPA